MRLRHINVAIGAPVQGAPHSWPLNETRDSSSPTHASDDVGQAALNDPGARVGESMDTDHGMRHDAGDRSTFYREDGRSINVATSANRTRFPVASRPTSVTCPVALARRQCSMVLSLVFWLDPRAEPIAGSALVPPRRPASAARGCAPSPKTG